MEDEPGVSNIVTANKPTCLSDAPKLGILRRRDERATSEESIEPSDKQPKKLVFFAKKDRILSHSTCLVQCCCL